MNRDIIDINDFTILVETANSEVEIQDSCFFDESIIAIAFYGSGNVDLNIKFGQSEKKFSYTKGLALSFSADEKVEFVHTVSSEKPLECIVIATSTSNLNGLPNQEGELFGEMLSRLVNPQDHYEEGPSFFMTPEMQSIVDQVFHNKYKGKARILFFKSQITTLLAHFFGQLSLGAQPLISKEEKAQLELAKEILSQNLNTPPSLSELSLQIGLNTFKLKKNFKTLFGVPVFKYLQNERLNTANLLLRNGTMSIQETAWHVGYDSLSSFSNAFAKKFGFRPSEIKR
jgi:AraC-like DNA-binding protein